MTNDHVWVLTREYNDYDQYGEYFDAVFKEKPTLDVLKQIILGDLEESKYTFTEDALKHILSGGGRRGVEYTWFHLKPVKFYQSGKLDEQCIRFCDDIHPRMLPEPCAYKRACVRMGAVSAYETCLNLLKSGTPVDGMILILESNIKSLNGDGS
jgi:hypothetical protein